MGMETGAAIPGLGETGVGEIGGAIVGAIAGSIMADKAQNALLKKAAPDSYATLQQYTQEDLKDHPLASTLGGLAGSLPAFRIANPVTTAKGAAAIYKIAVGKAKSLTKAQKLAAHSLATQIGLGTGMGAVAPLIQGQKPTKAEMAQSLAQTLLFGEPRFGGKVPTGVKDLRTESEENHATGEINEQGGTGPQHTTGNAGGKTPAPGGGDSLQPATGGEPTQEETPGGTPNTAQPDAGGTGGNPPALPHLAPGGAANIAKAVTNNPQLDEDLDLLRSVMEDQHREIAGRNISAKRAEAKQTGKRPHLGARPDGVPDVLDAINEEGGLRPPNESAGGEYDGWNEAMNSGPARMLRNTASRHGPDTMVQALQHRGFENINTPDDLWQAIKSASAERQKLPAQMRRQDELPQKQAQEFETFQKSLNYHDDAVWSGNTKLADIRVNRRGANDLIPTPDGENLPPEWQQHVIDKYYSFADHRRQAPPRRKQNPASRKPADLNRHKCRKTFFHLATC